MMSQVRRKFNRPFGSEPYRKLFVISAEGDTENQYFEIFKYNKKLSIDIKLIGKKNHSAPKLVLERIEKYIVSKELKKTDEAWVVVDKDNWDESALNMLCQWSKKKPNYGFVLSNPKFEYWLLLHFEDGTKATSSSMCTNRLKRYLSNYDKSIDSHVFTNELIEKAIRYAKNRDHPSCADWPKMCGSTTVYRLVEKLLKNN